MCVWHRFFTSFVLVVLVFLDAISIPPGRAQVAVRTTYGTNVSNPGYYAATDAAYVDILRKAGGWSPGKYTMPPLTDNGYPTADLPGAQSWEGPTSFFTLWGYNPGQQILNFYGEGIFTPNFNGNYINGIVPGSLQKTVNGAGITVTTCQVSVTIPQPTLGGFNVAQGIPLSWITITKINPDQLPNGYPNNLRLIAPGYPAWQPGGNNPEFTNEYLTSLAPFCSLRFTGWQNANGNNDPYSWADRSRPGYYGSGNAVGGTCYEDMIDLCNQLNCDMWIAVPLQATNDWKTNFATLVKQRLKPGLHCRYEHGNELWNWGYPFVIGWAYVDQLAKADGFGPSWLGHGKEMGKLLMSDASAMQGILGSTGQPVLSGQFVGTDYCKGGLQYINDSFGPPNQYIYAIAGAPYVSLASADPDPTSVADVMTSMNDYLNSTILTALKADVQLANQYGVKFCCYEGGQGLPSQPEDTFNLMWAAQQDSGMATMYYNLAAMMQAYNVELFELFSNSGVWSKFGFWGRLPLGSQIYNPTVRWVVETNLANAANGRNTGGGGDGGGGGGGNPWQKHTPMPSKNRFMMPRKGKFAMPPKSKGWPINGHPYRPPMPKSPGQMN